MKFKEEFLFILLAASDDGKEISMTDAISQYNNFFDADYRKSWDDQVTFWNYLRKFEYDKKILIIQDRNPYIIFKGE